MKTKRGSVGWAAFLGGAWGLGLGLQFFDLQLYPYWTPLGLAALGASWGALFVMSRELEQARRSERLRGLFGRFLEEADPAATALKVQKRTVTVLFCGMRGFSRLAEELAPSELASLLGEHARAVEEVVERHGGTVDRQAGGAVRAVFGAPRPQKDHAARAAACALELAERMAAVNGERRSRGLRSVFIGVALNSGPAVVGPLGPQGRSEYGAVGETADLAERLEALNEKLGTAVLATQAVFNATRSDGFDYRSLGMTPVHGRLEPLLVYELVGRGLSTADLSELTSRLEAGAELVRTDPGMRVGPEALRQVPMMGRYEIERKLAEGAMGAVYLARDPRLRRPVAVKTMRFGELPPEEARGLRDRFFREAQAAGRLQHPCIVQVYEAGEDQGVPYIAMEYLDGEDLSKHCRKDRLPPHKVLELGARIAEALAFAHEHGVVHRDVKPSNIMLLKDGSLRLTDFGIARLVGDPQTATGTVLGTPAYMSPEQVAGQRADGRSDLFSLGVVLFELLSGERPFKGGGDAMAVLMYQIASQPHPDLRSLNPSLPKAYADIVDRALQKDPAERFQSGREMAELIRAGMGAPEPRL